MKMRKWKNCHCEPATDVTGVAIRILLEMFSIPTFLRKNGIPTPFFGMARNDSFFISLVQFFGTVSY